MTKKHVGMQYVTEFSFPKEQGFTGSAGMQKVKGYLRGGRVTREVREVAKDEAKKAVDKHVKAPRPKGHRSR